MSFQVISRGALVLPSAYTRRTLGVIWGVSVKALRNYIPKERLMTSTLYQEILAEGRAEGEASGEARNQKKTILRILTLRLGEVEPTVRERVQALDSDEVLTSWYEEALEAVDSSAARKLVGKIAGAS
jgi:predicted transposase YdaD